MTEEMIAEHNRLFQAAGKIIESQIALDGQTELPVPDGGLAAELRHAISLYQRVLAINPENWSAMWFIGKVYQRFRNQAEAFCWFERSYQINPSQPDVAREASLCAMEIGRNEMAIAFAERATQLQDSNPGLHANLALAHLLAGHIHDAQAAMERALAGSFSDTTSQTLRTMIQHFATKGNVPPKTISALRRYWQREGQQRINQQ